MCREAYRRDEWLTASRRKHRESMLWQRLYRGHWIRDERDMARHVDCTHYNPVKHGLCARAADWLHSTFHRYVEHGYYPPDWGGGGVDVGMMSVGE